MKTVARSIPSTSLPRDVATERRGTAVVSTRRRQGREFGTGYGKSSGYASPDRRYAPDWRQGAFRLA